MILFRKQREKIGRFFLDRKLKKVSRGVEMKKINQIENAGIFFDASSEACRTAAKDFAKDLKLKNIQTWSLGYFDFSTADENFISDKKMYFSTLKDFSFFFLPKSEEIKEFIDRKVDILFVFSANDPFPAKTVVAKSRAKLKVGFANTFDNELDLTFDIDKNNPGVLRDQIEAYL